MNRKTKIALASVALGALLSSIAVAQSLSTGGSSRVDFTKVASSIVPKSSVTYDIGSASKYWGTVFAHSLRLNSGIIYDSAGAARISATTTGPTTYRGTAVDGSVTHKLTSSVAHTSGPLLEIYSDDGVTLVSSVDFQGSYSPAANLVSRLGDNSHFFAAVFADTHYGSEVRTRFASPLWLFSSVGDGATAIALSLTAQSNLTNASAKLLSLNNNSGATEPHVVYVNGDFQSTAATLVTCAVAFEGRVSRDAAAGGTSGHRTRVCVCTSDGAGSPGYKWQNIVSATLGTTTTCPD